MDLLGFIIKADTAGSDRAVRSLDKMVSSSRGADGAVKSLGNSTVSANDRMTASVNRLASANDNAQFATGNLAAQFQDIGVTSAMGMSPLMIALQ